MLKNALFLILIITGLIIASYGLYLSLATENKCEVMREYINNLESTDRANVKLL